MYRIWPIMRRFCVLSRIYEQPTASHRLACYRILDGDSFSQKHKRRLVGNSWHRARNIRRSPMTYDTRRHETTRATPHAKRTADLETVCSAGFEEPPKKTAVPKRHVSDGKSQVYRTTVPSPFPFPGIYRRNLCLRCTA